MVRLLVIILFMGHSLMAMVPINDDTRIDDELIAAACRAIPMEDADDETDGITVIATGVTVVPTTSEPTASTKIETTKDLSNHPFMGMHRRSHSLPRTAHPEPYSLGVQTERGYIDFTPILSSKITHIVAEFYACSLLCDVFTVQNILTRAALRGGTHPVKCFTSAFGQNGINLFLLLEESHLAMHYWWDEHCATVDLVLFEQGNAEAIIDYIKYKLDPLFFSIKYINHFEGHHAS